MRILLTGPKGQVGFELERLLAAFAEVVPASRSMIDLANPDRISEGIRQTKPQLILNAAAYTAVDQAESEPEKAMQVNGVAPGVLAEEAKKVGARLVHYSTDYVFDGQKSTPYVEDDATNPVNTYGRTKLEGERRIAESGCNYLLIRTSWIYAPRGRNFFLTIANKARAGQPLRVVNDQHGVPSVAEFIAQATAALVDAKAEGVFNVVPSGQTTWHGFAQAIVDGLGLKTAVNAIQSSEYPTPARRPAYSVLDNAKFSRLIGKPVSWQERLEHCIEAWKAR